MNKKLYIYYTSFNNFIISFMVFRKTFLSICVSLQYITNNIEYSYNINYLENFIYKYNPFDF